MNSKIVSSRRIFGAFSLFFLISGGLCYAQLRSLYLKDLSLLQQSLSQRSDRLDERVRRNVVAVDALRSAITFEAKRAPTQSMSSLEYKDSILESSLRSIPDAMRVYFISPKKSLFLPTEFSEVYDSSLSCQPFFKLGTPSVNLMQSPYWTDRKSVV